MELGSVTRLRTQLNPASIISLEEEDYSLRWGKEEEEFNWCCDKNGIILGVEITGDSRISFYPLILPKMRFKVLKVCVEIINPEKSTFDVVLGFLNRVGVSASDIVHCRKEYSLRAEFTLNLLDIDLDKLLRSKAEILNKDSSSPIYFSGAWLEIGV